MATLQLERLSSKNPDPSTAKAHHADNGFINPWPSFQGMGLGAALKARFLGHPEKNYVPVPSLPNGLRSDELVKIQTPDWASDKPRNLRATWLGHASWLVETPAEESQPRGLRFLFDPVFSERTSPFTFLGPKRYTPPPCSISDLPEIDCVLISHNHYDHLDHDTVLQLHAHHPTLHIFCPLGNASWFAQNTPFPTSRIHELDWWDTFSLSLSQSSSSSSTSTPPTLITCTPSQHGSGRSPFDQSKTLWSSWILQSHRPAPGNTSKTLFFAGDTAYQAQGTPSPCPIFSQIGHVFGPIDLALLPIGLMTPQSFMGSVHCTPEQAVEMHKSLRARLSVGMHYGTVRGGISAYYEDVRDPPRRWRAAGDKEGLWVEKLGGTGTDRGIGLCAVGETVVV